MEYKDFQEEQLYLAQVDAYIDKRTRQLLDKKENLKQDIGAGRRSMWEEGRHGVNDFDDVVDLYLHSEGIVADEKQYVENLKELQRLEQMKKNPYFARIDVAERGYPEELLYIGATGLRDDKTYNMYVCDWRAPISSLFYGYDVGPAWYEVDGKRVDVELKRKRQIQIEDGELKNIYDTDSSMHDAILGDILSAHTGNKLKVIISSIQKEQNVAIRKIDKQAVLIYGPAGSGKTSVGLHRLAYILYHQRERLRAENIVILSNNNIYHSYVSGILPALCEDEVSHTIFHELLRKFVPGFWIENYYAQYVALQDSKREARVRIKYSGEFLAYVQNYFESYKFETLPLMYRGHVIATAQEVEAKFRRNKYNGFRGAFEGLLETIRKLYDDYFEDNKQEICEDIEARVKEYVSAQELEILFLKARKHAVQESVEALKERNVPDVGEALLHIMEGYGNEALVQQLRLDLERHHLCYEDALLYLLVRIYMGDVKPFANVLHVLIDEAQDYQRIQLLILKLLYPKSSFTLLADVCQAISPLTTIQGYEEFEWVFGKNLEKLPLLKSYRSSGPINALAFHLMSMFREEFAQTYSYFQREGELPQYIVSKDKYASIYEKLQELKEYQQIGIITRDESAAIQIYHKLLERGVEAQLLVKPNDEMKERIMVMPLILTKGLEFDAVLVCGCILAEEEQIQAMNMQYDISQMAPQMYLACTRALHELYFVEENELPLELEGCKKYLKIVYE